MYLVIKQENWSSGSKYYNISMNTKDYDLAVEYARCKQKEAFEKEKIAIMQLLSFQSCLRVWPKGLRHAKT